MPENLAKLLRMRSEAARLTIYVGFAAGVGKTYKMLADSHELKNAGVDVVCGYIETHGRKRTEDMIGDLEVIPRKKVEYKGVTLEELDAETVIARSPQVALIDELAYTNVPGSKNRKRFQDVEEVLDARINIFSTLNIQHLESINEFVEKATKVKTRETVPDRIVRGAELVNVDLLVDALRQRLREGQVYPPERIERARGPLPAQPLGGVLARQRHKPPRPRAGRRRRPGRRFLGRSLPNLC